MRRLKDKVNPLRKLKENLFDEKLFSHLFKHSPPKEKRKNGTKKEKNCVRIVE